jgi:hypothetical protein
MADEELRYVLKVDLDTKAVDAALALLGGYQSLGQEFTHV